MQKNQPQQMAPHLQQTNIFLTPVLENILFFETRNKSVGINANASVGDPHPNQKKWPHHRLSYIESIDNNDEWYRYYYVCPFEFQDLYNANVKINGDGYEYLPEEYEKPKNFYVIERLYVLPRETKVTRPDDYAPDPHYGSAAEFVYQESIIHEDPRIRNLFDIYKRVYETLPGYTQSRMSAPSSVGSAGVIFGAAQQYFRRTRTQVKPPMAVVAYEQLYNGNAVTGFEKTEYGLVEEYHIDGLYKQSPDNARRQVSGQDVNNCEIPPIFVKRRHTFTEQHSTIHNDLPEIVPDASGSWNLSITSASDDEFDVKTLEYQHTAIEGVEKRIGWETDGTFGLMKVEYFYVGEGEEESFVENHPDAFAIDVQPQSGCWSLGVVKTPMHGLKYSYWTLEEFSLPSEMDYQVAGFIKKKQAQMVDEVVGQQLHNIGQTMKFVTTDLTLAVSVVGRGNIQGGFPCLVEVEYMRDLSQLQAQAMSWRMYTSKFSINSAGGSLSGEGLTPGFTISLVYSTGNEVGWEPHVVTAVVPPSSPARPSGEFKRTVVQKLGMGYVVTTKTIYVND